MRTPEQTATVDYQVATYEGSIEVACDENDDDEYIIGQAKRILTRRGGGSLPYGCEYWKVISRN